MLDLDPFTDLTKPYERWDEDDYNPSEDEYEEMLSDEEREERRQALIDLL
jgi:hypothetical protein